MMPDRDVYDRNVPRGSQTAARHVYEGEADALVLAALVRALGQKLKHGGCPGIDTVASILSTAIGSADLNQNRRAVSARLNRVRRECGNARTEVAVDVALRILADPGRLFPSTDDRRDVDRSRLIVTREILIDLIIGTISCPTLTRELVEREHKPIGLILSRREHARDLLASAPQITKLAREALACPEGTMVRIPRTNTPKPSLEEMTFSLAISA